jgi:hypothetical protein
MKNVAFSIIAVTALTFSIAVYAQSFTFDVVWKPVERVGGMTGSDGNLYGGGAVSGTYTTTYADGTKTNGTARCVGMSQPQGSIFAIHLACTTTEGKDTATEVYGCNYLGKPGPETALGCVGGIEGKTGPNIGRRGALTMEWYSETGARGTGQWYSTK